MDGFPHFYRYAAFINIYEKIRCSRFAGTHMYLRIQHIRTGQMQRGTGNLCIGILLLEGTLVNIGYLQWMFCVVVS